MKVLGFVCMLLKCNVNLTLHFFPFISLFIGFGVVKRVNVSDVDGLRIIFKNAVRFSYQRPVYLVGIRSKSDLPWYFTSW